MKRQSEKRRPPRRRLAQQTHERIRDERQDPELDVFEKRLQWFRETHTDRLGCVNEDGRRRAVEHAATMGRAALQAADPGGAAPRRGFELTGKEDLKAQLRRAENPRSNSSFGFASQAVAVRSDDDLRGATGKIALDKEMMRGLDAALTSARCEAQS